MATKKATKTADKLPAFFRKGGDALSSGNSIFLGLKEGESILFAPLVEMDEVLSLNMHEIWEIRPAVFIPCIGAHCAPCESGHKSRFRAYLPIVTKEGEAKILPVGVKVFRQLKTIAEDASIKGNVMRLRRTGSGFSTDYILVAIGRKQDVSKIVVPNVVEAVGPTTMEEIEKLWVSAGFMEGTDADTVADGDDEDAPFDLDEDAEDTAADAVPEAEDDDDWDL